MTRGNDDSSAGVVRARQSGGAGVLDDLARIALRALHVPLAVIAFDAPAEGRTGTAALPGDPWLKVNATQDLTRLVDPRVADDMGLHFYAGVPLRDRDGTRVGTFAVLDRAAHAVSDEDLATLKRFASVAEALVANGSS